MKKTRVFLFILLITMSIGLWGQFIISAESTTYMQDFDTLTSGAWANGVTLTGWYARTDLTSSITAYTSNTGTTTTAGFYAFGANLTNPFSDRALGYVSSNAYFGASGVGKGYLGWRLKNNTGSTISSITVTWTGEQWRKENNAAAHTLNLYYQTGSTVTDLIAGTWTSASSVFTSPIVGATTATAIDGNASANRVANISATISGLSLANGSEIMLRWEDLNDSGSDHFMAIDDVSIIASAASIPTISVSPASLTGFTYVLDSGPSAYQSFTLTGSNLSANLAVSVTSNYAISTTADGTYGSSLSYTPTGGSVTATVYVRQVAGLAIGTNYTGTVTCSSTDATPQSVSLSGTVTSPPPPAVPVATTATSIGNTSFTANWDAVIGATGYRLDVYTMTGGTNTTDLFISEYIEGSSNNKAIEIYNGTGAAVDLSGYKLCQYNNGSSTVTYTLNLSGSLADDDVYVIVNSSQTIFGTNYDLSTSSSVMGFNGNDAVGLFSGTTLIDVVGPIGDASNWGIDVTLVRQADAIVPSATYDSGDWDSFTIDTTTYLGSHTFAGVLVVNYVSGYQDLTVSGTSQVVSGLTAGTTYYYVVRAVNAYGTSANSNEITVTTTSTVPVITVTGTFSAFSTPKGTASAAQSVSVTGSNLTANIGVSAVAGYEYSTTGSDPWTTSSLSIAAPFTLYARLTGASVGSFNGTIQFTSTGATQVDRTVTGTVSAVAPVITNVAQTPATGITSTTTVSVSADVTDTAKSVASVKLQWGTSTGNYPVGNDIVMSLDSAPTYTTVSDIPAQINGTTVYYRVQATDDDNATTNSPQYSYTVQDPIPDAPVVDNPSDITDNSFIAHWQAVTGATGYYLDVYTQEPAGYATDLIISEYVEGSGYNKAIEIYNGTGASVDLSSYILKKQTNGAGSFAGDLALSGNLAHGDVYVIVSTGGTPNLAAEAYVDLATASQAVNFNGNDAVALYKNDGRAEVQIDVVGIVDQLALWGAEVTLVRKSSITSPSTTFSFSDWDSYTQNTFSYLGSHTMSGSIINYVTGYENLDVGDVTSYPVTDLAPSTVYYYVVRAYNEYGVSSSNSGEMELPDDGTTPVELSSFTAVITAQNYVMINWTTQTETNVAGYYLYRNTTNNLAYAFQIPSLIAATNTSQETYYSFIDQEVQPNNTYYYWLQNMDLDGTSDFHGPISVTLTDSEGPITPIIPTVTELLDAYPNPFSQSSGTRIHYTMKDAGSVKLEVYNVKGQMIWIQNIVNDKAGDYRIYWNGKDMNNNPVSTGVYYYRMSSGKYTSGKKIVLIK